MAIQLKSNFAEAYNNRGLTYFTKGEIERSIEDLNKAIELKPDYTEAYYNRGIVWSHQQQWEKARLDLTIAKVMRKDNIESYQHVNKYVTDFEQKYNVKLPEDIAALLTPRNHSNS